MGAKFEIHELMRRLAKEGCAILVISSNCLRSWPLAIG